jgi:hypothetical protein
MNDEPVPQDQPTPDNSTPQPTEPTSYSTPPVTPATPQPSPIAPTVSTPSGRRFNFKRLKLGTLPLVAIIVALLLGGSAAAYFGLVVPNKPENLWPKALSNTSKAYDSLVADTKQQKEIKGGTIDGSYKVDTSEMTADGTFKAAFYDKTGTGNLTVGTAGARFNLDVVTLPAGDASYPDVYVRVSGLKGLGGIFGGSTEGLDTLDNQWFVVDHTLFAQLQKEKDSSSAPKITKDDIVAIEEAIGRVNRDYLFSSDPSKAVLKVAKNVGKETKDGRSTYHYLVGYDKEHLKAYVTALHGELKKTKIGTISKDDYDKQFDLQAILKDIDKADGNATVDTWVDLKTKLIRSVRFTDTKNKENQLEVSLNYNGGSSLPFVITFKSKEAENDGTGTLKLTVDSKLQTSDLNFDFVTNTNGQMYSGNIKALFKASDAKVNATKPDNVKSITEVLGPLLGGGGSSLTDGPLAL